MKTASSATRAILATGQFFKADLYDFILANGTTLRWANHEVPIKVGANVYDTGLIFARQSITQRKGIEVQSLTIDVWPQFDKPGGAPTIGGAPFLAALRARVLDGARVKYYKIFLSDWNDTSPGAVLWFPGRVNKVTTGRQAAEIIINSDLEMLNVAMPRNIIQPSCLHTLFDAGCGLLRSAFTQTGVLTGTPTVNVFNTNLTRVDKFFDLGTITFTSGPNAGLARVIRSYLNASGHITLIQPLPSAPVTGTTFSIVPGCLKSQAACSNNNVAVGPALNNLPRFRGYPYVPQPETLYDGGTAAPAATQPVGQQGGLSGGTDFSGKLGPGTFRP